MSEHWKSTPKYWCKYCSSYVRDTKLERQNHEATARHQGAVKRSLRELHRSHEREERQREWARQEISRLNGVVAGASSSSSSATASRPADRAPGARATVGQEAELRRQREELAGLGVAIPDSARAEMAMAGEWTVTSTRVLEADDEEGPRAGRVEAMATGVRKRAETEEQKEEEQAIRGLFKKARRWGRDSRPMPGEEDDELEALLSGTMVPVKKEEGRGDQEERGVKQEEEDQEEKKDKAGGIKAEAKDEDQAVVKEEPIEAPPGLATATLREAPVKAEESERGEDQGLEPVVFKKRTAKKGMRTR